MRGLIAVVIFLVFLPAVSTADVDWSRVPVTGAKLFYPGMTSWEYLIGGDHAGGAADVSTGGKRCQECHVKDGKINIRAGEIIKGRLRMKTRDIPFEPEASFGSPAVIQAEVQAAYDSSDLFIRVRWPSAAGTSLRDPSVYDMGTPDRVSIQFNRGLKAFDGNGCFISCHDDSAYMPDAPAPEEVSNHPFYKAHNKSNAGMYLYYTRTMGWAAMKPEQELERFLKVGAFMDLWTAGFKGEEIVVSDESVFYDRIRDEAQEVEAKGGWENGFYTVVFSRPLGTDNRKNDIQFKGRRDFAMGIAVHDGKSGHRKHYVSFPLKVVFDKGKGDVTAVRAGFIGEGETPVIKSAPDAGM